MNNSNINNIYREHIRLFLERRKTDIYGESIPLKAEFAHSVRPVKFSGIGNLTFRPAAEGDRWGEKWESAWFHLQGEVPENWQGKTAALLLNLGGEILLTDAAGVPLCGLTAGSVHDPEFTKERWVIGEVSGGEKVEFYAEAAANHLFGVDLPYEVALNTPHPEGSFDAVVKTVRLVEFRTNVWKLLLDIRVIFDAMNALPEEDYRANIMLHTLHQAVCIYQDDPDKAVQAGEVLQKLLKQPATASALTVYAVGHAHLDVGWLWPVRESIRKAARTFASQLRLMEKYPEYIFGASQPQLYMFVKEHYPELYRQIKRRVAEGRWDLQGGMWVEADCNLISGESMIRQFIHGKNFFMDEFGIEVKNLWLPDVFGYSAAMPQIIRKSGCDFFLTQKLSWSTINTFPHETFIWQGIDGSQVLAHFPPEKTYNSKLLPSKLIKAQNTFKENAFLDKFISLFGIGDGGGGPNEEYMENFHRVQNWEYTPKVCCRRAEEFFEALAQDQDKLEKFTGELYLEFHRGTFTTQAKVKRANRKNEQLLAATEFIASHLPLASYPAEELDRFWKTLLCNQFHDIIPGSSIGMVYKDAAEDHAEIASGCRRIMEAAAEKLLVRDENQATVVNTLPEKCRQIILLPESWQECEVKSTDGRVLPVQDETSGKTAVSLLLDGCSFTGLVKGGRRKKALPRKTGELILENDLVRFEFDPSGRLLRAVDKETSLSMLSAPGNVLTLYHDQPNIYEAWDVEIFYPDEVREVLAADSRSSFKGEVYDFLEFTYHFGNSVLYQKIKLDKNGKRLDFENRIQWHEVRKMLRTAFPVAIDARDALFDIQYGNIRRSTGSNTSWEAAQFEVCGHRYADISDSRCGAALLNDCKYGYRVKGSTLDLALLRSPKYPDFSADTGEHEFTYSFYLHSGNALDSGLLSEAAALNREALLFDRFRNGQTRPFCRISGDGVSLGAVKKAEKSACHVIRTVETKGRFSSGELRFSGPVKICRTDLIEWRDENMITLPDGRLELELSPFEIRTYKVFAV